MNKFIFLILLLGLCNSTYASHGTGPEPLSLSRLRVEKELVAGFFDLLRYGRPYSTGDEDLQKALSALNLTHLREIRLVDSGILEQQLYEPEKHGGNPRTFGHDSPYAKVMAITVLRDFKGRNRLQPTDPNYELLLPVEIQLETVNILMAYLQRASEMTKEESLRFHPAFRAQAIQFIIDEIEAKLKALRYLKNGAVDRIYGNFIASLAPSDIVNLSVDFRTLSLVVENRIYHLRALDVSKPSSLIQRCTRFGFISFRP